VKRKFKGGLTSVSLPIFVADTSSTTGGGLSGVTSSSSGLVLEYRRAGQSTWTSVTAVTKTLGIYVSGGIVADGSLAGAYEIDFPDAAFASGSRMVLCRIRGVTNMLPVLIEIELDAVDYQDATSFGLSRLNDTITSRMASYTQPTGFLGATFPEAVASPTNITQASGVTLAAVTHTGAVIPTVSDITTKSGYSLSSAGITAIFATLTNTLTTVGSIGKLIVDNLNAAVGSIPTTPLLTGDTRLNNLNAPIGSIPTNPLLTTDSRLNNLNAPIGSIPTNPLLTTDSRLNNLNAPIGSIPTNPLLTTDTRLNFLDASIATSTSSILGAITGLNNLSAKANLFGVAVLESPETGSSIYEFTLVVNDDEGKLVNLDTTPTITATNSSGTNRSANLSAVTNPSVGRYRFTYTVSSTHPREGLRIEASGTISTEARYAIWAGAVVDFDQSTILSQISSSLSLIPTNPLLTTDSRLNNLNAPLNAIPTNPLLTNDSRLNFLDASIAQRATQTSVDALPNTTRNLVMNSMPSGGWTSGSFGDRWIISNNSNRTIGVTGSGSGHVQADIHATQTGVFQPTTFTTAVYDTITANLLATSHSSYTTPGTVGKTLTDTNTSLSTLITRIPAATAQLVTDLALMLVGSGTALVRWTVQALSLAPSGGGGQTITAVVAVPQLLEQTAFELDEIVVYRGCHWAFQVQNLGDLAGYTEIWFTLRKRQNDKDAESALQISFTQGLLIANKFTSVTPTDGSLTVSGQNVTIQVKQAVTQFIEPSNNYDYDIKGRNVANQTIMLHESDKFIVKRDVTRRIS